MEDFMLQLINMSVQAAIAVGVVLVVRLLFARLGVSRKYVGLLWLIPYVCMVCPWKLNSPIGIWESNPEGYQVERARQAVVYIQNVVVPLVDSTSPTADADVSSLTDSVSSSIAADGMAQGIEGASRLVSSLGAANIVQGFWTVCGGIWVAGILVILSYSVFSYVRLKKRLLCCVPVEKGIYFADGIDVPFVFGLFRTEIYFPSGMEDKYLQYVTEHERTHIRRRDPIKKFVAFCVTCIHWFNPFAWLAFSFFGRDMEMACDEETIEKIGTHRRRDYANALLALSIGRGILPRAPLAFGEGDTENRIKNILGYKKTVWISATVAVLIVIVLAVCFFTTRSGEGNQDNSSLTPSSALEDRQYAHGGEQNGETEISDSEQNFNAGGQNSSAGFGQGEKIEITPPQLNGETVSGADGPLLDYADERFVVFHDYYGLFVYDMEMQCMTGALDLKAIGCQYTQGDNYCEVSVEEGGSRVYLHPLSEKDMYVFDVQDSVLTKREYSLDGVRIFRTLKQTGDCVNPNMTVLRSYQCATLRNDNAEDNHYLYLYLESGSGMAIDLCYVISTTSEERERRYFFADYDMSVNNGSNKDMNNSTNNITTENIDTGASTDIREDIIDVNEISALGGVIEFAGEMTYSEFKELNWTSDVDNSLAEDERLYVVKIYYPDGFMHNKAGMIENCEAIGLYRADGGEYLGGSFVGRIQ